MNIPEEFIKKAEELGNFADGVLITSPGSHPSKTTNCYLVEYISKGFTQLTGWTDATLVGEPLETLIPEERRAGHDYYVSRFVDRDESERSMGSAKEFPLLDSKGSPVRVRIQIYAQKPYAIASIISLPVDPEGDELIQMRERAIERVQSLSKDLEEQAGATRKKVYRWSTASSAVVGLLSGLGVLISTAQNAIPDSLIEKITNLPVNEISNVAKNEDQERQLKTISGLELLQESTRSSYFFLVSPSWRSPLYSVTPKRAFVGMLSPSGNEVRIISQSLVPGEPGLSSFNQERTISNTILQPMVQNLRVNRCTTIINSLFIDQLPPETVSILLQDPTYLRVQPGTDLQKEMTLDNVSFNTYCPSFYTDDRGTRLMGYSVLSYANLAIDDFPDATQMISVEYRTRAVGMMGGLFLNRIDYNELDSIDRNAISSPLVTPSNEALSIFKSTLYGDLP